MSAKEFCTLCSFFVMNVVYTIEKRVAVVNMASDYCVGQRCGGVPVEIFANASKLAHVVVATLYQDSTYFYQDSTYMYMVIS